MEKGFESQVRGTRMAHRKYAKKSAIVRLFKL